MTEQDLKRAKELSSHISILGKGKNLPQRKLSSYLPIPEKEFVGETAQSIANKLNSIPNALGKHVVKDIPTMEDIVAHLRGLKGNDRLDISNLRNGEQLSSLSQRVINGGYNMNDLRWHGSGGSSTNPNQVSNEVVAGSVTTFTLTHAPVLGSEKIFAIGQRLTPGVGNDYTIAGAVITTANSWLAGQILADYLYL